MTQQKQAILLPDYLSVRELAELIGASPIDVMKRLIANGVMASINQQIDYETAAIIVGEMGLEAQSATEARAIEDQQKRAEITQQKWQQIYADEKAENLVHRPPIVTILGHVDHGKTTLLDTIRKAHVAEGEAGGITQHIGAYQAKHNGRLITFLDTPGHEAFTAMRARGAAGADIAILVVAADDGVMPTTREALNHARAANVPILVVITKVDKRNANVEQVKQQLSELDLVPDDWDGTTMMIPVSAPQGEGIDDLLEAIILLTDDMDIVANPNGVARGTVIESKIEKNRGTIATLLVMNGTLKRGDVVVAGMSHGRVKAMYDATGAQINEAGPSTPVAVLGLNEPPQPGERFERMKNDKVAREMIDDLKTAEDEKRGEVLAPTFSLEDLFAQFRAGETKDLNLIIKVDVQGSLQPIVDSIKKLALENEEGIGVRILASEVGNISESDVMLASASNAIIIGFNIIIDNAARMSADAKGVDIRFYNVIYKLLEDIDLALKGMLTPKYEPVTIGVAEVRQLFRISKIGVIAGSYVREGEIKRNAKARVKRNGEVIVPEAKVTSLKRFNEDVREVRSGFECGISLDNFNDFKEGDFIEFFEMQRV